ncbi:cation-transporting P-type ATPase, partial [Pseudonocardia sp. SCN 73-27]
MQTAQTTPDAAGPQPRWTALSGDDVAQVLGVHPDAGLSSSTAAERLHTNGPNALPQEAPEPGWRRFLDEYRSYMQIILLAAAVVSAVIAEWGTAVLLLVLTVLNAVIGLRQKGKAMSCPVSSRRRLILVEDALKGSVSVGLVGVVGG